MIFARNPVVRAVDAIRNRQHDNTSLFCGPWHGEFGWELCWWNPLVRYYSQGFRKVVVAAPASSRYLYEFATEFIPLNTVGEFFWHGQLLGEAPRVMARYVATPSVEFDDYRRFPAARQPLKWRQLRGTPPPESIDAMCAFRPTKISQGRVDPSKEYPFEKSREIVQRLLASGLKVGCYGLKDNFCFDGAQDLRELPLEQLCGYLAMAKVAVGPSSGTLHLAGLCGTPFVTWYKPYDASAQYRAWNPFHTPMSYLSGVPEPATVVAATLHLIARSAGADSHPVITALGADSSRPT